MTSILATMSVDPWILSFSFVTVVVTIFMGFWSARKAKTASDFFVAGRSVSVGWNASAISGEYLSAASFMGVAGMVMSSGYDALWYPVCYACGYLFLLLFIAGPLRRFGAYTIPDFAEGRFDSPLFRKIAVVFVLFIGFFYTMPQMKGAGTTLAYIFQDLDFRGTGFEFLAPHDAAGAAMAGLNYAIGVIIVGAVITLNVALGGMKGITLVQAFQYWAKMFAISVPVFVLMSVYGHYGKQLALNGKPAQANTTQSVSAEKPATPPSLKFSTTTRAVAEPVSIDELKSKASVRKPGMSPEQTISANIGNMPTADLMKLYEQVTGQPIFILEGTPGTVVTSQRLQKASPQQFREDVLLALNTNQIATLLYEEGLLLMPISKSNEVHAALFPKEPAPLPVQMAATEVRKPLPEKAPQDAAWMSPFGPLTTKAIKAANPKVDWTKSDLLKNVDVITGNTPGWLARLKEMFKGSTTPSESNKVKYGTGEAGKPLSEVCIVLQHWSGVARVFCATNLWDKSIVWNADAFQSPKQLVASLEQGLKEQGVTLLRANGEQWWVVPTSELKTFVQPLDPRPYSLLYTYSLIIALVCGTAGLPHILVRFYTNPDGVAAKRTTMWVMILIGIFYVFPPVFGVMGRNFLPELYAGTGAKGTDKIVLELPRILNARVPMLGSILSGIACAGAFAAFMSTFSGLLVSMTGAMAHDVYGRILKPDSTPQQRMRAFKIAAFGIGAVAVLLGMQVEQLEINFMVGQAFAIAAASYFPLLFMAVWWRGLTMKGAATGMLTGGLLALLGISLTSFSSLATAPTAPKFFHMFAGLNSIWAAHPLLRILCEQPAIWAVPLAIILMIVISKLTQKDIPSDIRMKMLVLHAPEKLGLKQEYIQEHQPLH